MTSHEPRSWHQQESARPDAAGAGQQVESSSSLRSRLAEANAQVRELEVATDAAYRIGMAVGILMSRRNYSERQAYGALQQVSLSTQRLIRDVADHVIRYGDLRPG